MPSISETRVEPTPNVGVSVDGRMVPVVAGVWVILDSAVKVGGRLKVCVGTALVAVGAAWLAALNRLPHNVNTIRPPTTPAINFQGIGRDVWPGVSRLTSSSVKGSGEFG